jgi:hypothetical protein
MDMVIPLQSFLLLCFLFCVFLRIIFFSNRLFYFIFDTIVFLFSCYFFIVGSGWVIYIWCFNYL